MADLSRPDIPRTSAALVERSRHEPDASGHFGGSSGWGGRYVPEALMAVIEEVTTAHGAAGGIGSGADAVIGRFVIRIVAVAEVHSGDVHSGFNQFTD